MAQPWIEVNCRAPRKFGNIEIVRPGHGSPIRFSF